MRVMMCLSDLSMLFMLSPYTYLALESMFSKTHSLTSSLKNPLNRMTL